MIAIQDIKNHTLQNKRPLLCAHRGGKQTTPENTLSAFSNALNLKCPCIELDIHLTLDKQLVVIHDETLKRTTNGNGNVHEFTMNQLKQLDAGSWYDKKFKAEKLPTLEEVLDLVKDKALLLIEIKDYRHPEKELERVLLTTLKKHNLTYDCILHSFDRPILERLHNLDPKLNIGFLYEKSPPKIPPYAKGLHPAKSELEQISAEERAAHWIASWTFRSTKDYTSMRPEFLPDILIADPIEDFCKELKI